MEADTQAGRYLTEEAALLAPFGLEERARAWLLDGDDVGVLDAMAGSREVHATVLGHRFARALDPASGRPGSWRHAAIAAMSDAPGGALVRLGRFLHAASDEPLAIPRSNGPDWLAMLLPASGGEPDVEAPLGLDAAMLVAALEAAGHDATLFVDLAMFDDCGTAFGEFARLRGAASLLEAHADRVERLLHDADHERSTARLRALDASGADPSRWRDRLAELALASRRTVARAARPLVERGWGAIGPRVRELAMRGDAGQRLRAVELLARRDDADSLAILTAARDDDRSAKVREAAAAALRAREDASADALPAELTPPPRIPLDPPTPLTADQRDAVQRIAAIWQLREAAEAAEERRDAATLDDTRLRSLVESLERPTPWPADEPSLLDLGVTRVGSDAALATAVIEACADPAWTPVQIARLVRHLFPTHGDDDLQMWSLLSGRLPAVVLRAFDAARERLPDLRDVDEALTWTGLPRGILLRFVHTGLWGPGWWHGIATDRVWPLVAEHLDTVLALFEGEPSWPHPGPGPALELLRTLPALPERAATILWNLALGTGKTWRRAAQEVLAADPDRCRRVSEALQDGKQDVRAIAARWIGDDRLAAAGEALERALDAERADPVRAEMLTALERLGREVSRWLDRDGLTKAATKALAKIPANLAWLTDVSLVPVHWADTGEPLDEVVVRGWMVQTVRRKAITPDPLLRRYVGMLRPRDAHALGRHLLDAWIAEDTRTPTTASKEQIRAWRRDALARRRWYPDKTVEDLVEDQRRRYLSTPSGSAIAAKGLFAVIAACGGCDLAEPVARYLRAWGGHRTPQCKALLALLAEVDDRHAIQVVLATAIRFRTAGIRKEAARLGNAIAASRGWTADELADRTLPTAGFDEDGRQGLVYFRPLPEGADANDADTVAEFVTRRFTLSLADDLTVVVARDDGKTAKSLPAPRKDEDEAAAKAARKALSNCKRAVQQIVALQSRRLREAMCTERSWPAPAWREFLAAHPIVGRLCRRLVWTAATPDGTTATFRPLDDGTLTTVDDEPFVLDDAMTVTVAHGVILGDAVATGWRAHLADFEIDPPFEQFPTALVDLPEGWQSLRRLDVRRGWMTTAFTLRGRATERGWVRGETLDAGIFTSWTKPFPSLGLEAVLHFSGSTVPEEEHEVAIDALSFERILGDGAEDHGAYGPLFGSELTLGDVPPGLLAECRADLAAFAEGSGFDPDWERRTSSW